MRIPPVHYLTIGYATHFRLKLQRFRNSAPEGFLYLNLPDGTMLCHLKDQKHYPGVDVFPDDAEFHQALTPIQKLLLPDGQPPKNLKESLDRWNQIHAEFDKHSTRTYLRDVAKWSNAKIDLYALVSV